MLPTATSALWAAAAAIKAITLMGTGLHDERVELANRSWEIATRNNVGILAVFAATGQLVGQQLLDPEPCLPIIERQLSSAGVTQAPAQRCMLEASLALNHQDESRRWRAPRPHVAQTRNLRDLTSGLRRSEDPPHPAPAPRDPPLLPARPRRSGLPGSLEPRKGR